MKLSKFDYEAFKVLNLDQKSDITFKRFLIIKQFQNNAEWLIKINHKRDHKLVICALAIMLAWFTTKPSLSWYLRSPHERDLMNLICLACYIICTDITAIILIAHYTFLVGSSMNRFCNFAENFQRNIVSQIDDNVIIALDEFVCCYEIFECLVERINSVFCLQVIDPFIAKMIFQ